MKSFPGMLSQSEKNQNSTSKVTAPSQAVVQR